VFFHNAICFAATGALVFLVNGTTQSFFAVNKVAGWLMVPYFAWSLFAWV